MHTNKPFTLFSTALKKACIESDGDISNSELAACIKHLGLIKYKNCQFLVRSSKKWTAIHAELILDQIITKTIPNVLRTIVTYYDDEIKPLSTEVEGSRFSEFKGIKSKISRLESAKKNTIRLIKCLGHPDKIKIVMERCKVELSPDLPNIDELINAVEPEEQKEPEKPAADAVTIGVANGTLQLTPELKLFPAMQERHTSAAYYPYDPNEPTIKKLETILKTIFSCEDDYYYWMEILASCLFEKPNKKAIIWIRSGNCGVSTIMELHKSALGFTHTSGYTYIATDRLITGSYSACDLDSTVHINDARTIVVSETDSDSPMKLHHVSNLMNFDQEIAPLFKPELKVVNNANLFITTNNILVDSNVPYNFDWSKLLVYNFRKTFLPEKHLDSANPNHILANPRFARYCEEKKYRDAYLSILTHFITTAVPDQSGNVYSDTMEFRSKHEPLFRFISEKLCLVGQVFPNGDKIDPIPVTDIVHRFLRSSYNLGAINTKMVYNHPTLVSWIKGDDLMCHVWKD